MNDWTYIMDECNSEKWPEYNQECEIVLEDGRSFVRLFARDHSFHKIPMWVESEKKFHKFPVHICSIKKWRYTDSVPDHLRKRANGLKAPRTFKSRGWKVVDADNPETWPPEGERVWVQGRVDTGFSGSLYRTSIQADDPQIQPVPISEVQAWCYLPEPYNPD